MPDIKRMRVQLDYPLEHVKEPIIFHLVTDYHLVPNIRRANIDVHSGGMMVLELEGTQDDIDGGVEFLRRLNITVSDVGGEHSWAV